MVRLRESSGAQNDKLVFDSAIAYKIGAIGIAVYCY